MKSVCVLGLGYIGLPTSVVLAKAGFKVVGVDINEEIIINLNSGNLHFEEPGLNKVFLEVQENKSFEASLKPKRSDVFIIAVPTPIIIEKNNRPIPNIEFVIKAAESISKVVEPENIIIIESTSPIGTSEKVLEIICDKSGLKMSQIYLAYCPERVLPGNILNELVLNNRIIGGINKKSSILVKEIYDTFCKGEIRITDSKTAELVKLTENSYRDVNIAFANELSMICHELNVNTYDLINLCNLHPRVNILKPGCGVGGHCIAIDPWFLVDAAPKITPLIQTARMVNDSKVDWAINLISKTAERIENKISRKPKIGCFGLTFKADVDDIRESPALKIVNNLIDQGFNIISCEKNIKKEIPIKLNSPEFVLKNADFYVVLVNHKYIKSLDLSQKYFIDLCGTFEN